MGAMAIGMVGAAGGGVGIGLMLPNDWLKGLKKELNEEIDKDLRQHAASPSHASASEEHHSDEDQQQQQQQQQPEQRENSTYENVKDIAEDIPRPAIIQDATRDEVESLYEFHSCIASGGSATVWRATEIATGKAVAIKVKLRDSFFLAHQWLFSYVENLILLHCLVY